MNKLLCTIAVAAFVPLAAQAGAKATEPADENREGVQQQPNSQQHRSAPAQAQPQAKKQGSVSGAVQDPAFVLQFGYAPAFRGYYYSHGRRYVYVMPRYPGYYYYDGRGYYGPRYRGYYGHPRAYPRYSYRGHHDPDQDSHGQQGRPPSADAHPDANAQPHPPSQRQRQVAPGQQRHLQQQEPGAEFRGRRYAPEYRGFYYRNNHRYEYVMPRQPGYYYYDGHGFYPDDLNVSRFKYDPATGDENDEALFVPGYYGDEGMYGDEDLYGDEGLYGEGMFGEGLYGGGLYGDEGLYGEGMYGDDTGLGQFPGQ